MNKSTPFRLLDLPTEIRFMIYEEIARQSIITRDDAYLPLFLLASKTTFLEAARPMSKSLAKMDLLAMPDPSIVEPIDGKLDRYQRFRDQRLHDMFGRLWSHGNQHTCEDILFFERQRAPRYREWWRALAILRLKTREDALGAENASKMPWTRAASKRAEEMKQLDEKRRADMRELVEELWADANEEEMMDVLEAFGPGG